LPETDSKGLKSTALRFFEGLAANYERTLDYATLFQDRRWKVWAVSKLAKAPGDSILDLGCGTLLLEQRLLGRRFRFVGLDLTRGMLVGGRSKRLVNVDLLVNADAESLPFSDAAFDAVVSCYVPKYVAVPRLAREVARVTRVGGHVVLYDFARPRGPAAPALDLYTQAGLRAAGYLMDKAGMDEGYTLRNLPGVIRDTRWDQEVRSAMEAEGIEELETKRLTAGTVFAYWGKKSGALR
jgi:ubiquinone/menaquinone biosynthesis C-methylase UbiE